MIDIVSGQVASIDKASLVVMVGGIGFKVNVPNTVFDVVHGASQSVTLYTYLVVREDALTLYGFVTEEDRILFETLISVSGVGPKMALSILSSISTDYLRKAVTTEDPLILTRVPGIGKKTAEKIIFELKGKMGSMGNLAGLSELNDVDSDLVDALTGLGYSVVEAQSAIQAIPRDAPKDFESRMLLALQYFR